MTSESLKSAETFAFVVTKPIQLITALSTMFQIGREKESSLLIVDLFLNSKDVFNNIKKYNIFGIGDRVNIFANHSDVFKFISEKRIGNIFLDSDVGFQNHILLSLVKLRNFDININVYDEGIGTYRTDIYKGFRKIILNTIGAGTHFGGNVLTSNIFVYDINKYKENFPRFSGSVIELKKHPFNFIKHNWDSLRRMFSYRGIGKTNSRICNLYLSSWEIDVDVVKKICERDGDFYIKTHPHIKNEVNFDCGIVLDGMVPAEMIIAELLENYDLLNVYHHNSTVEKYIKDYRVNFKII